MARKKKQRIGFDPLAWMKGGVSGAPAGEPTDAPEAGEESVPAAAVTAVAAAPAGETPADLASVPENNAAPDAATPQQRIVDLGGALTIAKVSGMHAELQQALEDKGAIVLDAATVTAVDTAGLQLIGVFLNAARECGVTVTRRAPSGILRAGAKRLDLEKILHFPA